MQLVALIDFTLTDTVRVACHSVLLLDVSQSGQEAGQDGEKDIGQSGTSVLGPAQASGEYTSLILASVCTYSDSVCKCNNACVLDSLAVSTPRR